jgi:serine/threonine protein phosphatase PrpC
MGGMADGSRCAEIALSSFLIRLTHDVRGPAEEAVRSAAFAANTEVNRQYRERGGTTLVAIVVFPGSAAAVSVGDSRVYEINARKELKQISSDDTIAGELDKLAGLNSPRSGSDSFAGQLAQFIGIGEGIAPRIYPVNRDLAYLLTSDGVHGYGMSPDTLRQVVASGTTTQLLVSRLLQVSRWCGGNDNATAICVSPLRANWSVPPAWGTGEWLEIWDSIGKMEMPAEQPSMPAANQTRPTGRIGHGEPKTKKQRKRTSGTSKEPPNSTGPTVRPPSAQGSLKIEIVDEKPRDPAPGMVRAPDTTGKENTSGNDQLSKREQ